MKWRENFNRPEFFSIISNNHFLISSKLKDQKFFYEVKNSKIKKISKKIRDFFIIKKENFDVFIIANCSKKIFVKNLHVNLNEIYKFENNVNFLDGCFNKKTEKIFLTDGTSKSIFILDLKTKKIKKKKIFFNKKIIEPYAINIDEDRIYVSDRRSNSILIYNFSFNLLFKVGKTGIEGKYNFRNINKILISKKNIIVNDQFNYKIKFYNKKFQYLRSIGGKGNDTLKFDLVSNLNYQNNKLWICDYNNDRIFFLNSKKNFINRKAVAKKLSRPVNLKSHNDKFLVCDRDNNSIKEYSDQLKFIKKLNLNSKIYRPTSIDTLQTQKKKYLVILEREKNDKNQIKIFKNNKLIKKSLLNTKSAQHMRVINQKIWISDTNNRRLIVYNKNLKKIRQIDLSKISKNKKIQCKYFLWDGINFLYFTDYERGEIYKIDLYGKLFKKISFINNQLIRNLRSIHLRNQNLILMTKSKNMIWRYNLKTKKLMKFKSEKLGLNNPTDIIYSKKLNCYILCDKENDRIIGVNLSFNKIKFFTKN